MRAFSVIVLVVGLTASLSVGAQDVDRGKGIFEGKGNCLSCHRVNGNGSLFGPNLSVIGAPPRQPAAGAGGRGGQAAPPAAPTDSSSHKSCSTRTPRFPCLTDMSA